MAEFDASFIIGGGTDGTNPDTDTMGPGNTGGYGITTGGSSGGGLGDILKANSDALVNALNQTADKQIGQLKKDGESLVEAITNGTLLKNIAMKKISDEMAKHGINSKDYMDKKTEHLDYAKNGNPNLKDTDGKTIIPRDAAAKHNSEKAIETANMNKTDFGQVANNIIDDIEDTEDIDINIMVTAIKDMFGNIDFDNLPTNLKES